MRHLQTPSPTNTTEEQDRIGVLEEKIEKLEALVAWYEEKLRLKNHQKFGASSEKFPIGQLDLLLFDEAEITAEPAVEEPDEEIVLSPKRKKSARKTFDESLPVEIVTHSLPEEERACLSCGNGMHVMKKETRRELVIIPAQVKVIQHEREVYACRTCEQECIHTPIVQAPMPNSVFPKSMASPSSVAYILTRKYMAGTPLYRLENEFKQLGVNLSRQTMSNWVLHTAEHLLEPVFQQMKKMLLKQTALHADETTLQVLKEQDRSPTSSSYMWLYRTGRGAPKCVLFDYQTTRSSKHPKRFLEGFKGKLHVDGYKGYNGLPNITLSGCWAHARRYFDQAQKAAPSKTGGLLTLAEQALQKIGQLYKIEKQIASKTPEERLEVRHNESMPLVQAYFTWLKTIRPQVLPKSKLGEAIQYSLNQQKKLEQPFMDGLLDIDNNLAERSIKPFVIGRKNWLFSNSSKGAKSSALVYSLVETAKENDLNVFHYLSYLFETLPNIDLNDTDALDKLLPWSSDLPDRCRLDKKN